MQAYNSALFVSFADEQGFERSKSGVAPCLIQPKHECHILGSRTTKRKTGMNTCRIVMSPWDILLLDTQAFCLQGLRIAQN
jgi:hypothetical protein